MAKIQVLPKQVADMIAAGEVVERPASAAKELIENSIDAGAGEVTVEIRHGGVTYLRVTDDGQGIPAQEVPTAFLRHATSKIRGEADLEAIATLGFRGEALAALAAVAHVEMLTKPHEAQLGHTITIEGGQTLNEGEAGCPDGTTVVVRSLFFNVPARYKFLKRDAAEGSAVHAVVQREALAHPEVAFRFIRDGQQEFATPGDDNLESAVYATLGRELARDMVRVQGSGEAVAVTGFVTRPTACRGSRAQQFFFVNGRWIRSKLITAAVENAYRNQKMVGKFPGCVLHIAAKYSAVDVNSHPTKTEVKFVRDKDIYDAVYYAVLSTLGGEDDRPVLRVTSQGIGLSRQEAAPPGDRGELVFDSPAPAWHYDPSDGAAPPSPAEAPPAEPAPRVPPEPRGEEVLPVEPGWSETLYAPQPPAVPEASPEPAPEAPSEPAPPPAEEDGAPQSGAQETLGEWETPPWRVVGEVLKTYIIVEQGERVFFIDKHAAHERMNFDALKAQGARSMSQELLAPVVCRPGPEEAGALLENLPVLEELGFEVSDFGGGSLAVSRVPHFVSPEELPQVLGELAQKLLTTGRLDPDSQRDELLHTMACKAAIKGGQKNDPAELFRVAQAVMSGQVRHCPHGRPVCAELTRGQLERQFKRA